MVRYRKTEVEQPGYYRDDFRTQTLRILSHTENVVLLESQFQTI